jgi:hypothetical protein
MKFFGASLIETVRKLSLRIFHIDVKNSNNGKIVNKNIRQVGNNNSYVGGDFNTNRYTLQVKGTLVDKEKGAVKMELYKIYENNEEELVKNPYWSMYVPGTQGGWIYDYQKLHVFRWSKNGSPFTEVAVSLYGRDRNRPEDIANFSYTKFLDVIEDGIKKNET